MSQIDKIRAEIAKDSRVGKLILKRVTTSLIEGYDGDNNFEKFLNAEKAIWLQRCEEFDYYRPEDADEVVERGIRFMITDMKSETKSAASHLSNVQYTEELFPDIYIMIDTYETIRKELDILTK